MRKAMRYTLYIMVTGENIISPDFPNAAFGRLFKKIYETADHALCEGSLFHPRV